MKQHPLFFTASTRRGIFYFCGLIALLLIYKHIASDRLQTLRIEKLEAEVEELRFYVEHSGGSLPIPQTSPATASSDRMEAQNTSYNRSKAPLSSPTEPVSDTEAAAPSTSLTSATSEESKSAKFRTPILVDLNSADSVLLCRIPGIGEKTAAAILRYRNRLGGYTRIEQVAEAARWVEAEQIAKWQGTWLTANADRVQRLPVNSADFKTLLRHPYLDYPQVKAIFQVRQRLGRINSWSEIAETGVFSDEEVERLKPYIWFD
jgi:DNA uptake protein ComE-like DNA-binding protein